MRPTKAEYYLNLAAQVSKRGTCLRKNYGAVIVTNDAIVSTGYTGAPRGCDECKTCVREELSIPSGERYDICRSIHAEQNAILHAGRDRTYTGTLYLSGYDKDGNLLHSTWPCPLCSKLIINAGIFYVYIYDSNLKPMMLMREQLIVQYNEYYRELIKQSKGGE